jgi:Ser/Thr protein kinase RdoA (MazF antagonist)
MRCSPSADPARRATGARFRRQRARRGPGIGVAARGRRRLTEEQAALRDCLLARLEPLLTDEPRRAEALATSGGPERLPHGDLGTPNAIVSHSAGGLEARLIDWDHAGMGPASYDLSTFLLRFPPGRRKAILDLYERCLEVDGGRARVAMRSSVERLKRQLWLPVSMMSQWWVRRSSNTVVILGSPNIAEYSHS